MKKKLLLCTTFLLGVSLFTGCFKRDNLEDIKITTTSYPIQYITEQLYGDYSTIESIYPLGVDIKNYKLTDKQIKDYSKSSIYIFNGLSQEKDYVVPMFQYNKNIKIIDTSLSMEYTNDMEELWLDPSNALMLARNIKNNLEEFDDNVYNRNSIEDAYADLKIKISEIDVDLTLMGKNASRNTILVNDDTLLFLSKYNIKVLSVDSDNADYTKNLNEAKNLINSGDIKYIYKTTNSTLNEEISNIVSGYKLEELEIETMFTITDEERKNNDNYLTIMENNITKLKTELFR